MMTATIQNIVKAEVSGYSETHWVNITSENGDNVTLFLASDKCNAIAEIINGANKRLTLDEMFKESEKEFRAEKDKTIQRAAFYAAEMVFKGEEHANYWKACLHEWASRATRVFFYNMPIKFNSEDEVYSWLDANVPC